VALLADITFANDYFSSRVFGGTWFSYNDTIKNQALQTATDRINLLAFAGVKKDSDQPHEFPRSHHEEIPENVKKAVCEEAFAILERGEDPDPDFQIERESYAGVSVSYNSTLIPVHKIHGMTSYKAWNFLVQYLKNPTSIRITRT